MCVRVETTTGISSSRVAAELVGLVRMCERFFTVPHKFLNKYKSNWIRETLWRSGFIYLFFVFCFLFSWSFLFLQYIHCIIYATASVAAMVVCPPVCTGAVCARKWEYDRHIVIIGTTRRYIPRAYRIPGNCERPGQ